MASYTEVYLLLFKNVFFCLKHFWISISMVFFIAATTFTLLKLCVTRAVLVAVDCQGMECPADDGLEATATLVGLEGTTESDKRWEGHEAKGVDVVDAHCKHDSVAGKEFSFDVKSPQALLLAPKFAQGHSQPCRLDSQWERAAVGILKPCVKALQFEDFLHRTEDCTLNCGWKLSSDLTVLPSDFPSSPHHWIRSERQVDHILSIICGISNVVGLGWWDLFINYGYMNIPASFILLTVLYVARYDSYICFVPLLLSVAECFAFLICTKWYNPSIHRRSHLTAATASSSSSSNIRSFTWNNGVLVPPNEENQENRTCSLQDIGGHIMKVPLIGFQVVLFMYLEGTPPAVRRIPIPLLFSPLLLLQGIGFLFAIYRFFEKISILLNDEAETGSSFRLPASAYDYMGFLRRGSRFLGWWSIDEGSREEQARLYSSWASGYNTFSPDTVKKMPKSELAKEIGRLQSALISQTEITNISQEEFDRLLNEKILCRVCFDEQINVVLLPCRHYALCSTCCEKCKRCPICRVYIDERLHVYDDV
ncbi:hypothetical protein SASPL_118745 [Salvia splendens]|uniref:RING-type domain-containing protein n=1 Tax=Salvia splendens TaxID=180675 RepID=A0A8X8XXB9_SALSN|nr:hypothetical protein SASPL_118745 [Salvia splendens]